ncbi:MAG TPA: FemAB family PEP-CTERM system-associated protein [Desulfobacterales bacterium]|nr:FemAB family PEP-CTERM system-associated protein [Desulfobacterales bacterium]
MLAIQTVRPTDQQQWDSFVRARAEASPYHLFAWGKAINEAYGHKLHYLIARKNKEIVGVLPLVNLNFPFLVNNLTALPFCDVGNCLCDDEEIQNSLIAEALKIGDRLKTKRITLRGEIKGSLNHNRNFAIEDNAKVRMLLTLPPSSEILLKSFKSKLRSQIRKAEKNGVIFRWAGAEGVEPFYAVFCRNMRDLGSPVHSRQWFQAVMRNYGPNARIGLTEFEGKCIGAGLILSTSEQTAIPWASTLRQYNRQAPNMLLYWNCLKFAADNGKKLFDFGRSTEDEGTFRFKKQWGAAPAPLLWYSSPPNPRQSPGKSRTEPTRRETAAEIWKKLPAPIANLLGPQLRKYIDL